MFSSKSLSADNKLNCACDKSFADDLVSSRCCKYESNLCITIYWGFCGVSSICSSLNFQQISANFRNSYNMWSNENRELESRLKLKGHRTRFRVRCPFFFCTFFARIHFHKRVIGSSTYNSYRSHFGSRYHIDPHHCDPLFVGDNGFRKSHENCSFDAGKRKSSWQRF